MAHKKYWLTALSTMALTACANMQMGWYKSGATNAEFAQDKYACMERSQEQVSGAYVNPYGGAASSGTTTNIPLFQACMEARGYTWTSRAQVDRIESQYQETPQQDSTYGGGSAAYQSSSNTEQTQSSTSATIPDQTVYSGNLSQQVRSIEHQFLNTCGLNPTAERVCGPLSALDSKAHSLAEQVKAGTLSEQDAERELKADEQATKNSANF